MAFLLLPNPIKSRSHPARVANFTALSKRFRQPSQLDVLSLRDGLIVERFTRGVIFFGRTCSFPHCREPSHAQIQKQLGTRRLTPLRKMPKILIVDGVWVEIQYTSEEFKLDRAGHLRQMRNG